MLAVEGRPAGNGKSSWEWRRVGTSRFKQHCCWMCKPQRCSAGATSGAGLCKGDVGRRAAILRPQLWPAETANSRKWAVLCKDGCKNYSSQQLSDFLWCLRGNHNQDHKSFCRTTTFLTEQITAQLHFLTLPRPSFCVIKVVVFCFWDTLSPPYNFGPPLHYIRKGVWCCYGCIHLCLWKDMKKKLGLFSLTEWKTRDTDVIYKPMKLENTKEAETQH